MSWMQTRHGHRFDLAHPDVGDVDYRDIAYSLARINRFNGHTTRPYSVAQHSVEVSLQLPQQLRIYGLLHDAHEAYIGDISTPMKIALEYRHPIENFQKGLASLEEGIENAIYKSFALPPPGRVIRDAVKAAALTCLMWERRDLFEHNIPGWLDGLCDGMPLPQQLLLPWEPQDAEKIFTSHLLELVNVVK